MSLKPSAFHVENQVTSSIFGGDTSSLHPMVVFILFLRNVILILDCHQAVVKFGSSVEVNAQTAW